MSRCLCSQGGFTPPSSFSPAAPGVAGARALAWQALLLCEAPRASVLPVDKTPLTNCPLSFPPSPLNPCPASYNGRVAERASRLPVRSRSRRSASHHIPEGSMSTFPSLPPVQRTFSVPQLIAAMLKSREHVSDLIFSPGRAPQVEVSGQLVELKFKGLECLVPHDTEHVAYEIMGKNKHPIRKLEQDGSADLSYGINGVGRFRVNIFRQRGTCAIVMRVIPDNIPSFEELHLPPQIAEICDLRNGIVLVTGP